MRSTKFKNDLEVIFFEVFLLKMFVAYAYNFISIRQKKKAFI